MEIPANHYRTNVNHRLMITLVNDDRAMGVCECVCVVCNRTKVLCCVVVFAFEKDFCLTLIDNQFGVKLAGQMSPRTPLKRHSNNFASTNKAKR